MRKGDCCLLACVQRIPPSIDKINKQLQISCHVNKTMRHAPHGSFSANSQWHGGAFFAIRGDVEMQKQVIRRSLIASQSTLTVYIFGTPETTQLDEVSFK
jgi:hypothetical protein